MEQGGYRKPENPAPVSGPGALSQRTDGGPSQPATYISGLPYGEGQATYDQQTAAPMSSAQEPMAEITPLMAPTSRPNEPITSGVNTGAGPGSEVMMDRPGETGSLTDTLRQLIRFDPTGETELIYRALVDEGY
jgi:hypothetical protein